MQTAPNEVWDQQAGAVYPDAVDPACSAGHNTQPQHCYNDESYHKGKIITDGFAQASAQHLPRRNMGGRVIGVNRLKMELVLTELAAVLSAMLEPLKKTLLMCGADTTRALTGTEQNSIALPANAALLFVVVLV